MEQGDSRQEPDEANGESGREPGMVDRAIALSAPLLDLLLAVGERVSRIAEPVDYEYYPVHRPEDTEAARGKGGQASGERSDDDRR